MLAELVREKAAGKPSVDRQTTVGNVLISWLDGRHDRVAAATWVRYESQVRYGLAGLARVRVSELTADNVRAHLRTLSPAAGSAVLRILRSALERAVRDGTVERNVAVGVAPPKRTVRTGVVLTDAELARLYQAAYGTPFYALWTVLTGSGPRMGEALGLRWTDLDFANRRIHISGSIRHQSKATRGTGHRLQRQEPKTAAGKRVVPMTTRAAAALLSLPQDAIYVFHRGHGRPLNPSTVQRAFAALLEAADLEPMRLHDLRHSWVSRMLARGASLDDVKRLAGHSSIQVTSDTYSHLVSESALRVAGSIDEAVG